MKVLHHPHSSQCFGTDIGYYIYIPYWNWQFPIM
jgi:hypothetical protein